MSSNAFLKHAVTCITILLLLYMLSVAAVYYFYASGHSPDYSIKLPGDYVLVRTSSNHISLCRSSTRVVVVGSSIDEYAAIDQLIVGHVSVSDKAQSEETPGFFMVDTKTGAVVKGLDEKSWLALLRKKGLAAKPMLRRPTR